MLLVVMATAEMQGQDMGFPQPRGQTPPQSRV